MRRRVVSLSALLAAAACGESLTIDEVPSPASDAGSPIDAGGQQDGGGEAGASPFCDGVMDAAACTDFTATDLAARFTALTVTNAAVAERDTTTFTSAPASLRLESKELNAPADNAHATLDLSLPDGASPPVVTLSAAVNLELGPPSGASVIEIARIYASSEPEGRVHYVSVGVAPARALVRVYADRPDGGVPTGGIIDISPLPLGKWIHVVFVVDMRHNTVSFSFDGTVLLSNRSVPTFPASARRGLYAGLVGQGPLAAQRAHFDDVVVRLE